MSDPVDALTSALRLLQDAWAASHAPDETLTAIALRLEQSAAELDRWRAPEGARHSGQRRDLPGFGQVLVPPLHYVCADADQVEATLTCGDLYLGSGGMLHGGVAPLIFDDVLGRLANNGSVFGDVAVVRTAYLHVDYRAPAPVGAELRIRARVTRAEGRKRWQTAELTAGDVVVAEAEGLFIAPRE